MVTHMLNALVRACVHVPFRFLLHVSIHVFLLVHFHFHVQTFCQHAHRYCRLL
jgi:hypothetical protein